MVNYLLLLLLLFVLYTHPHTLHSFSCSFLLSIFHLHTLQLDSILWISYLMFAHLLSVCAPLPPFLYIIVSWYFVWVFFLLLPVLPYVQYFVYHYKFIYMSIFWAESVRVNTYWDGHITNVIRSGFIWYMRTLRTLIHSHRYSYFYLFLSEVMAVFAFLL